MLIIGNRVYLDAFCLSIAEPEMWNLEVQGRAIFQSMYGRSPVTSFVSYVRQHLRIVRLAYQENACIRMRSVAS